MNSSREVRGAIIRIGEEVRSALAEGRAVVALESTVITHGLPRQRNLEVARELEGAVRARGAIPATIALLDGVPTVGVTERELELLATRTGVEKVSTRDLPLAMARGWTAGTTVAATTFLAHRAGIPLFATGGIGGVHRGLPPDISADLFELGRTPILVVCAGAKSVLDLPATRELLETLGILTLGWKTDSFPAFYRTESTEGVDARVESVEEVIEIWRRQRSLDLERSILLCVPIPEGDALPAELLDDTIEEALEAARASKIRGKAITPYLLARIAERSGGAALEANVALLRQNAALAGELACKLAGS